MSAVQSGDLTGYVLSVEEGTAWVRLLDNEGISCDAEIFLDTMSEEDRRDISPGFEIHISGNGYYPNIALIRPDPVAEDTIARIEQDAAEPVRRQFTFPGLSP